MSLYLQPFFKVEASGSSSDWKRQDSGIRQGCPLSPYLFIAVMHVAMSDTFSDLEAEGRPLQAGQIPTLDLNSILYADDTALVSTSSGFLSSLLQALQRTGRSLGLHLNMDKCELLRFHSDLDVFFDNGQRVKLAEEARYIGCFLNDSVCIKRELRRRIAACMSTWKRMDDFWLRSACSNRFKIHVWDAVVRSKLLFGLETMMLTRESRRRLDVFQLKGLRKILRMVTTYVDPTNRNDLVYARATAAVNEGRRDHHKVIERLSTLYVRRRLKYIAKIVLLDPSDTRFKLIFKNDSFELHDRPHRRSGRPRFRWDVEAFDDLWTVVKQNRPQYRWYNFRASDA
eukprot:744121-Prorocentrum_lima.AAC.1